jgi:phosphomannomutase
LDRLFRSSGVRGLVIEASGTELLIRLTVEGESLKAATNIMTKGTALVKRHVEDWQQ